VYLLVGACGRLMNTEALQTSSSPGVIFTDKPTGRPVDDEYGFEDDSRNPLAVSFDDGDVLDLLDEPDHFLPFQIIRELDGMKP